MSPGGSSPVAAGARPGMVRRVAPAVGLFFLSPFVAEFLLGNISVSMFGALLFVAPLYGGGAVLIREITRRTGRGWPTMAVLAMAYALIEEGLVTQTLFNPSYFGLDLLNITPLPWLGMGAWWTLFVLTLHVVWSMGASIVLAEALVPQRSTTPWLGGLGISVAIVVFVLGAALNWIGTFSAERFLASPAQLLSTLVAVVVLIVLAFRVRTGGKPQRAGAPPNPWLVGAFALAASSIFMASNLVAARNWFTVAGYLVLYAVAITVITAWSRRAGWGDVHRLALAGGALVTYMWFGFPSTPILGATGITDLAGNTLFAAVALALLIVAFTRVHGAGHRRDADVAAHPRLTQPPSPV